MKYKIRYTSHGIFTDCGKVECGNTIYIVINFDRAFKSICYTYQHHTQTFTKKINQLILTYFNLYVGHSNIFDKINLNQSIIHPFACDNVLDAFIYSYASYIVFIDLYETLKDILPFTFDLPCTLTDGDAASYQTLTYFTLPLTIQVKLLEERWIKDYFKTLLYFISTYASLFPAGAWLDNNQLTIDTLSGLTDYLIGEKSTSSSVENSFIYKEKREESTFPSSSTTFFEKTSGNSISDNLLMYKNKSDTPSSCSTSTFNVFDETSKNQIDDLSFLHKSITTNSELSSSSFPVINTFKKIKDELIWYKQ